VKVVADTNVVISGMFFSGPPHHILRAIKDGRLILCLSPDILEEYQRVATDLSHRYPGVDVFPLLALLTARGLFFHPPRQKTAICSDPDDDKFFYCAQAAGARWIVSGDRHLLSASGALGVGVLAPRPFADRFLK
jgi:uncharacterized protein